MNQLVSESDDLTHLGNSTRKNCIDSGQLVKGLAHDFKLALDCSLHHGIGRIASGIHTLREGLNGKRRFPHIPQNARGSRCINRLTATIDVGQYVGVAHGIRLHQVHGPTEQFFKRRFSRQKSL